MSSTGVLPVDLLEEIFTRLPVKSLITLTIICKSWLALITSQSFAKTHLSRYHLNPNTHMLLLHRPCRETIAIAKLNFLEIPRIVVSPIPISETPPAEALSNSLTPICCARNVQAYQESKNSLLRLVGSINGLVCFSRPTLRPTNVVIWNPATHKFRDVVVSHLNLRNPLRIYVAFGYDCVGDDYKVVCIYRFRIMNRPEMSFRFRMYSCKDDSWKELEPGFDFNLGFLKGCVTVKGNPFWAGVYNEDDIWLTVDVRTEVIRVFSGPEYVKSAVTTTSIVALGDNAAQIVYSHGTELGDMIRVYALEENSGTWTLMYAIESMGLQMPVHLECYKDGRFVTKDRYGKLFTYDLASEAIKDLGIGEGMEAHYMTINYIESLVAIAGMERVREGAAQEAGQAGQETGLSANDRDALDDMVLERIE
ncbi:hypothetical protein POM88_022532 [Heracleum sosnowskyi]|uniref:F-box domain-containing protein n=1 Tax=Heracleum sosnowskyi TaxID=360622 RepID=A0AAD8MTW8_9APIA|nr:hypothetical protein POM88_022532 [Heracleum sosnowskyi]